MEIPQSFIYLSPLPYVPKYKNPDSCELQIGPFNPAECVEFFWRTRVASVSAHLQLYVRDVERNLVIWDENGSALLSSENAAANSAFALPPYVRCTASRPLSVTDGGAFFEVGGPWTAVEYPAGTKFENMDFYYDISLRFAVGAIELSSKYIELDSTNYYTHQQFPFEIFGKEYALNLNVPYEYAHPADYGLDANFSADVSINFGREPRRSSELRSFL